LHSRRPCGDVADGSPSAAPTMNMRGRKTPDSGHEVIEPRGS
jgi:hypothetical protein